MLRRVRDKLGPLRTETGNSFPYPDISAARVCLGKTVKNFDLRFSDLRMNLKSIAGRLPFEAAGCARGKINAQRMLRVRAAVSIGVR